ncbi:hypothetical protein DB30_06671 [Enhygromyxa salina]|uniref:Uncharacterized protein n=1 Tax=Enhygromyxa salina TaxID=215803 RepID=A0A0C1ZTZ1_9BACT|nr:hypothetical protein DB30_06671 [Enhygromyxa salina]
MVLGAALWAAFAIDLGGHTFAEHIDTISETPEAKQLIDGTRSTLNPALQEVRDRVLGEYVEAPTWIPSDQPPEPNAVNSKPNSEHDPIVSASTLSPESGFEPALPGRGPDDDGGGEPRLPGRR